MTTQKQPEAQAVNRLRGGCCVRYSHSVPIPITYLCVPRTVAAAAVRAVAVEGGEYQIS